MDSLPQQFVTAMRTLFDIMDDKRTGYVKVTDIENRWNDDRTKGLPQGVVESLQKVASHDGLLTFDRFCTGLKICLLRNQVHKSSSKIDVGNEDHQNKHTHNQHGSRPPSAPILDVDDIRDKDRTWIDHKPVESKTHHRLSMPPQLVPRKDRTQEVQKMNLTISAAQKLDPNRMYGPPKPPRLEKVIAAERNEPPRPAKKTDVDVIFDKERDNDCKREEILVDKLNRGHGDGRPDTEIQVQRRVTRRREPRRHTLHNGIDYNLLKRMKQIEQEKDVLLQGLAAVEEAREWYLKHLAEIQEKIRYAGRMGAYVEPWSEAQQERLELLRARVTELNRQLGALASGWRHGPLSLHMNLALPAAPLDITTAEPNRATVLRTQNRMLVEEVNRKNEKISVLECEKSALIRELLLQRNRKNIVDNFS